MEELLSQRDIQSVRGLFSGEQKQESIGIEDSDPKGEIISDQDPEGGISTMLVVKWSYKVEGYGVN